MFPDLYGGFSECPGSTYVIVLRRGILVALLRSGARCRAAELAAESPFRVGLCGAAPEDGVPGAAPRRPRHEVQVVGTVRGLAELERRVVPSAPTAASDANERDETAR
jgi:hypothetical protein